jgi:hypothetical protein
MDRCPSCGADAGAPNVRLVAAPSERAALRQRYDQALAGATNRGAEARLREFTAAVEHQSQVVINTSPDCILNLLSRTRGLYANYHQMVQSGVRKAAAFDHDRQRCGVDGTIWGSMALYLVFGSLSMDGRGPASYGRVAMTISKKRSQRTASFLETNSFRFVEEHQLTPGKAIPPGHRSTWEDRHLLAGAKMAGFLTPKTPAKAFPDLLLHSVGNRKTDEFIEAFIYGDFDAQAVTAVQVQGMSQLDSREKQLLKNAREFAQKRGIIWRVE